MTNNVTNLPGDNEFYQLSKEQLVEVIKTLQEKIARLEERLKLDTQTSSKPPSQDLLQKPENKKSQSDHDEIKTKRKPGGQPGHVGKTRKGFGRVDRFLFLPPEFWGRGESLRPASLATPKGSKTPISISCSTSVGVQSPAWMSERY